MKFENAAKDKNMGIGYGRGEVTPAKSAALRQAQTAPRAESFTEFSDGTEDRISQSAGSLGIRSAAITSYVAVRSARLHPGGVPAERRMTDTPKLQPDGTYILFSLNKFRGLVETKWTDLDSYYADVELLKRGEMKMRQSIDEWAPRFSDREEADIWYSDNGNASKIQERLGHEAIKMFDDWWLAHMANEAPSEEVVPEATVESKETPQVELSLDEIMAMEPIRVATRPIETPNFSQGSLTPPAEPTLGAIVGKISADNAKDNE